MAYSEKYFISYCDDFGTVKRVSILKRDFVGVAIELTADVDPIVISYESSDDFKFVPIRPSEARVFMIFGTGDGIDFEEFWVADEKEFKIQYLETGLVKWSGYVIPDGFQYNFTGGVYHATLQAVDGLSTLEAIPFIDDNEKPYGNQNLVYNNGFSFPFSLILTEILKKLELDLDLWTCIDSYEQTMLKTGDVREADPLSASYVNVKTYIKTTENKTVPYWYGSGEAWNCKEVLENILNIFGAKIYQEDNTWRIKTINSDIDYGTGVTQRYWRKYNTAGVYLPGYVAINDVINIPCNDTTTFLIDNDHEVRQTDVYKSFRMNYEYTFVRDGDSPVNLLQNGNFCDFNNTSKLAAPTGWYRWRILNKWHIRIKDIVIPPEDAGGITCGIEIGTHKAGIPTDNTDPNPAVWTALRHKELIYVDNGSKLFLKARAKYRYYAPDKTISYNTVHYAPILRVIFYPLNGNKYYLRNNIKDNAFKYTWQDTGKASPVRIQAGFDPIPFEDGRDTFFMSLEAIYSNEGRTNLDVYDWRTFEYELDPPPGAGWISFYIHGLAASRGRDSGNFPSFPSWVDESRTYVLTKKWRVVRKDWVDQGGDIPRLQMTGLVLGIIPNESEIPQQQDYIYDNTNPNYTLQIDPITVYNGDTQDKFHISNIVVPTNVGGGKNFWDDLSDSYGKSSLGLLTVRQIMRQYAKPYRILEGNVKVQNAKFGAVYTFEPIPNARFILQSGIFNKQREYIEDGVFIQITDDVLPEGGTESGNTLDPDWQPTGVTYCQVDPTYNINTGYVIVEERDMNPNSETYSDTREVVSTETDLISCPIGEPRKYFWGSDGVTLNTANLVFAPFIQEGNEVEISMFNTDGNYLYFVYLKTLGVVERIYTPTNPSNVLEDWVALSDVTIDGYLYRVLRTDYIMTEFSNFTHNFIITA